MKLKSAALTIFFTSAILFSSVAQSKTTQNLEKQHRASLSLFFYQNTLRMINQKADPAFDEMIKDIEKMKFLAINKVEDSFENTDYKKLVGEYKSEKFEEIMTSRSKGKNFDIFLKGSDEKPDGMLVLVNDDETLLVLDIVGRINLNKITQFYNTLDQSSDIQEQLGRFLNKGNSEKKSQEKTSTDH